MIRFFSLVEGFKVPNPIITRRWLKAIIQKEGGQLNSLNYIFCSDEYLHGLNVSFLAHDTLTDVITFDFSDQQRMVEGEIYISIERIKENSVIYNSDFIVELNRVIVHGLLHLLGYEDKNVISKNKMTEKENIALSLRFE